MVDIFNDIKTAVRLTGEIRKARRDGYRLEVKKTLSVPVVRFGYWGFTMESSILHGELGKAVRTVFKTLPEGQQHALTFTPEKGEWAARARFWKALLKPVLSSNQYHEAMSKIIGWYVHCVRQNLGVVQYG